MRRKWHKTRRRKMAKGPVESSFALLLRHGIWRIIWLVVFKLSGCLCASGRPIFVLGLLQWCHKLRSQHQIGHHDQKCRGFWVMKIHWFQRVLSPWAVHPNLEIHEAKTSHFLCCWFSEIIWRLRWVSEAWTMKEQLIEEKTIFLVFFGLAAC